MAPPLSKCPDLHTVLFPTSIRTVLQAERGTPLVARLLDTSADTAASSPPGLGGEPASWAFVCGSEEGMGPAVECKEPGCHTFPAGWLPLGKPSFLSRPQLPHLYKESE